VGFAWLCKCCVFLWEYVHFLSCIILLFHNYSPLCVFLKCFDTEVISFIRAVSSLTALPTLPHLYPPVWGASKLEISLRSPSIHLTLCHFHIFSPYPFCFLFFMSYFPFFSSHYTPHLKATCSTLIIEMFVEWKKVVFESVHRQSMNLCVQWYLFLTKWLNWIYFC